MDAIDCQGFAGGFTLGTVQAGFRLVGKREHEGGFGVPACEANRHLLGNDWETECSVADAWTAYQVPYVFGNPPCSGFSLMSNKEFRGIDSKINSCMWDLMSFASRCNPDVIVMESVPQAFSQGRELMLRLREDVERRTHAKWDITHVMQDAMALGGCAVRRRYFFTLHRIPFGVEPYPLRDVPTLDEAIGDLARLPLTWEKQPYRAPASWWSKRLRGRTSAVDGHAMHDRPLGVQRTLELVKILKRDWPERKAMNWAVDLYVEREGTLPPLWEGHPSYDKLLKRAQKGESNFGYNQPFRWDRNQPARVITGGALYNVVHPYRHRLLTHREALRILGFPDNWRIRPLKDQRGVEMFWGKGVTVDAGRWISSWVRSSLEGEPGELEGEVIGDREVIVDVSKDWRKLVNSDRVPLRVRPREGASAA